MKRYLLKFSGQNCTFVSYASFSGTDQVTLSRNTFFSLGLGDSCLFPVKFGFNFTSSLLSNGIIFLGLNVSNFHFSVDYNLKKKQFDLSGRRKALLF